MKYIFTSLLICFSLHIFSQITIDDSIYTGGLYRTYRLYVPAIYTGAEEVPLLFNLHGYTSNNLQQQFYGNFMPIADTANFIMVLPNGTYDGFGFRYWNCFGAYGEGVDDVAFLSDLIDTIKLNYAIDDNKIYSTGMSNGGFMSYELACRLSDRIAAIASVCGDMTYTHVEGCDAQHPTPIMEIHGTADGTVPYNGAPTFVPIDSVLAYWIQFNNCNTTPDFTEVPDINTADGCTAEHYVYAGGANNTSVELFKILGGAHTWPGTFIPIGITNQDINASVEVWKFLSRYRLDALTDVPSATAASSPITIYPNPFSDYVIFNTGNITSINSVKVFDLLGNLIFSTTEKIPAHYILNTKSWIPGFYILQLETGEHITLSYSVLKSM